MHVNWVFYLGHFNYLSVEEAARVGDKTRSLEASECGVSNEETELKVGISISFLNSRIDDVMNKNPFHLCDFHLTHLNVYDCLMASFLLVT